MIATIHPSHCYGSVRIPPSKSMAHRAIICAALAKGISHIDNIDLSEDIRATIEGMRQLGADIRIQDRQVIVKGITDFQAIQADSVFCGESGSTLRFFIPIFSLCNRRIAFTGKGRLLKRPQSVYAKLFHEQGLTFRQEESGIVIEQALRPGAFHLDGNVSSQFITGLLFALPLLPQDSTLHIHSPFESRSYVELTLQMLARFHIQAQWLDENSLHIKGNQRYQAADVTVEGDYSQLAFFAVLAAIQGELTLKGVLADSRQGDRQILSVLQSFGAEIEAIEQGYRIASAPLQAADINLENCPDLGPIVFVLAAMAKGTTHIYNARRLRIKESDRIEAMASELRKFGVTISAEQNDVWITGDPKGYTCDTPLNGHNDHRIVMALSVMALVNHSVCEIHGAQAICKSYPRFFEDVAGIHGKVERV